MLFDRAHPALAGALAARGYAEPTPVQEAVLQAGAAARDLLVSAQTGSGKTVAYGLALAEHLLGGERAAAAGRAAGAGGGADARAGDAGAGRAGLAVRAAGARIASPASAAWTDARGAGARRRLPCRGRHARAAVRPSAPRRAAICRRCARWCWTRPTRCSTSAFARSWSSCWTRRPEDAAHADVLRHHRPRDRLAGRASSSATRCASTRWAATGRMPTSPTAPCGWRRTRRSTRWSMCCAIRRRRRRWCSAPPARRCAICTPACWSAASPRSRCPAS